MTSVTRTMSSLPFTASPAARGVRIAVEAAVSAVTAVGAAWFASRARWPASVIDDHTLRDVGIHRLDLS